MRIIVRSNLVYVEWNLKYVRREKYDKYTLIKTEVLVFTAAYLLHDRGSVL